MRTTDIESKREYIIELLELIGDRHRAIIERLFSDDTQNERSFVSLLHKRFNSKAELLTPIWAYQNIVDAAGDYIRCYHAPAATKQCIYQALYALCEDLGQQLSIDGHEEILKELPPPTTEDHTIALIKALHSREGITKEKFSKEHNLDKRTIQNHLQALNGNPKHKPLRIAGHSVYVPVKTVNTDRKRNEDQLYYTPNTLNPVILQLNTSQVAALLQSFYYSNKEHNIIPLDLAIDTWCQLSDYTKERIREFFCKNDPGFSAFIEDVDSESQSISYRFMSESDMLSERDLSAREQLALAEKGMVCDIVLNSPHRSRKRQIIAYDTLKHQYFAVSKDEPNGEKLYFTTDELFELTKSL